MATVPRREEDIRRCARQRDGSGQNIWLQAFVSDIVIIENQVVRNVAWDGRFRASGLMNNCVIHCNHRCAELRYFIAYCKYSALFAILPSARIYRATSYSIDARAWRHMKG